MLTLDYTLPRYEHYPQYDSSAAEDVVAFCSLFGLELDPWQQYILEGSLGVDPNGMWTAYKVGLLVPRQNGKSELAVARMLAGAFLFRERLIIFSAHEVKTAQEIFLRVRNYIEAEGSPLAPHVRSIRLVNGEQQIELYPKKGESQGPRIKFLARTTGSGRGFTSDCLIMDEAYALTSEQIAAIEPTMLAVSNSQMWVMSSAGMEFSEQLKNVRDTGIAGTDNGLAYYEWSADDEMDSGDPEAWRMANPALGIRLTEKKIERLYKSMPAEAFNREVLGHWFSGIQSPIPAKAWRDCKAEEFAIDGKPRFAVDISADRSVSAIGVAGRSPVGLMSVELINYEDDTDWVVERLVELYNKYRTPIILDPTSGAGTLVPELQAAKVELVLLKARDAANSATSFYDFVIHNKLNHFDQEPLNKAVTGAAKRALGDSWAWGKKDSTSDITPLVAVSNAAYGVLLDESAPKPKLINNFF